MKALIYTWFVLMQISFLIGSSLIEQSKCSLRDSPCLTASAQAFVPTLAAGIPELGMEQLDTMFIDGLHVDNGEYKTDWSNIYLQGLRNSIVDKLSVNTDSKLVRLVFHTDFSLKGHYVNEGLLFRSPISGDGEVTMQFNNTEMEFVVPFEIVKDDNGRDIMDLKSYEYWYDIKDGVLMHFGNLYDGNDELSEKMHEKLHQNWKELTTRYCRYMFDKSNDKIFNSVRKYLHTKPLDTISVY